MQLAPQPLRTQGGLLAAAAAVLIACTMPAPESGRSDGLAAGGPAAWGSDGTGMMHGEMMRGGMMAGSMQDMRTIRGLLSNHEQIERRVEDLPNGVRTVTTSDDPRVAGLIRRHVRRMRDRYDRDQPIRLMDPLFRALFENRDKARLEIRDVPGGVEVVHTSSDPRVVQLIRQHAHHFVDGVIDRGMAAAMGPTPLPEGDHGRR